MDRRASACKWMMGRGGPQDGGVQGDRENRSLGEGRGVEGEGGKEGEAVSRGEDEDEEKGGEGLVPWCLVRRRVVYRSYLFKLQLGPLANVGVGVEGCDDATSDRNGIHLGELARAVACSRGVQTVTRSLEAEWGEGGGRGLS